MLRTPGYERMELLETSTHTLVHAARCLETGGVCHVKSLKPHHDHQPMAVKRIQREARVLMGVHHPHLPRLQRAFAIRSPYFLVFDPIEGETLRQRLQREKQCPSSHAIPIVRQVAEAVVFLHRAGFLHGDIRPDTIRCIDPSQAVLVEFGQARRIEPGLEPIVQFAPEGYLAPELRQTPVQDHPRSDIFSLGVTLFELLTGQLPFSAGAMEESPALLGEFLMGVGSSLESLVGRMLRPHPMDRPHPQRLVHELFALEFAERNLRKAS